MQRFTFKRGLRFIAGQTRWELDRRLASGKLQLCSEDGEILSLTYAELLQRWQSQEWLIDEQSLANLGNLIYVVTPRDLSTYPPKIQEIAKRRLHYLQKLNPEQTPYNPENWGERIREIAEEIGDTYPPCPSTVSVWWVRYRQTRSILKLIPWNRPASIHQHKPNYAIFEEVIAEVYLTNNKLPKLTVYERIRERILAINQALPAHEQMKCPGRTTVYRWLGELQQDLVDLAREGAEAARMKYRAAIGIVKTEAILERIEIDHTPLDIIIIDLGTGLTLGRPWISLAIDHYSKIITGFYISIGAPSATSVLQCLRRAILPKDGILALLPNIKNPWPAYGIPVLIAVDNGPDLHSTGVEQGCFQASIQLLFCGSKVSYHKGSIERFIKTMGVGHIHTLPGTTFSDPDERGDYESEKYACLDMQTLTDLITKWIVDVYNVTPHRGIKGRPLDRWQESAQITPIALPVNPQELELIAGIPAQRTLFHYGVEFEGLHYNDQIVQLIRRRAGKNVPVDIKYYEDDVGHIHVLDPDSKMYLRVPARDMEYAEGLTREMHRTIRAHARKKFGELSNTPELLEAKREIQEIAQAALQHKKMGYRKSGARQFNVNSEAALAKQDPLAEARKPAKRKKAIPPVELPDGLDDNLPDFSVLPKKGGI
jgi:putative transposase